MTNKYLIEAMAIANHGVYRICKALHSLKESEPKYKIEDNLAKIKKFIETDIQKTQDSILEKLEASQEDLLKKVEAKVKKFDDMFCYAYEKSPMPDSNHIQDKVTGLLLNKSDESFETRIEKYFNELEKSIIELATNIKECKFIIDKYAEYFSKIDNNGDPVHDIKKSILYSKTNLSSGILKDYLDKSKAEFEESSMRALENAIASLKYAYDRLIKTIPKYKNRIKPTKYYPSENPKLTIADFGDNFFTKDRFLKVAPDQWPTLTL